MSNKYFSGRKGHYIFCDICGQAVYDKDVVKLSLASGRPGLLVCPRDADTTDYGLIPHSPKIEKPIGFVRINHTNVTNGTPPEDIENSTELGV